jgi:predicted nucleic acid-binding protein
VVTFFIDTAVLMYAAGAEHPLRAPCRRIVDAVGTGAIDAVISTEVIQEIVHRYAAIGRRADGAELATRALDLFAPALPITHALMRRVPDLALRYPSLAARDVIHVATCLHEGIATIVSSDRAFDPVTELRRIDPREFTLPAD